MWTHNYAPLGGNLFLSAAAAALPILTLLYLLGLRRKPAWQAALAGLASAAFVALVFYRMPFAKVASAAAYGAAHGLLPIGWVLFSSIFLYRITLDTGKFEIIKDSVGHLSEDRRMQALLIAFAFGAFIEGAAGFGAPVAVAAAMLSGLGFSPFYAAGICLLANTAPVAFGSIGTPVWTLSKVTGLPLGELSASVGRICAPVSLIVPTYLIAVMGGWKGLKGVLPGTMFCGLSFAATQFFVSNFVGPELTDILSSLAAMGSLVLLMLLWKPRDKFTLEGNPAAAAAGTRRPAGELLMAWGPYVLLVVFVLAWGLVKPVLSKTTIPLAWPGLDGQILQVPPVVPAPKPSRAIYEFAWLAAPGTACFFAAVFSALLLRMSPARFARTFATTCKQLALPMVTIVAMLALAFLMNISGATATLGLAFAATGALFPFFSSMLGWLGVFLTGSDTSANALFGNLQVVTANHLGLSPVLMAASNSSGGVMGKMISLQSIAVAAAATGMKTSEEAGLFRFTLRHSVILAAVIGVITVFYAYVAPHWAL